MELLTVDEHTIYPSLLQYKSTILDLGCRNFFFTKSMREMGHEVWPIDIDTLETQENYFQCGISDRDGFCSIERVGNDLQATRIAHGQHIPMWKLETFMKNQRIEFADLIKIDVEGAEFQIIISMERPLAKQLSIEFHLHTGVYIASDVDKMVAKLESLGYETIQHNLESRHGIGFSYWDSLFILK